MWKNLFHKKKHEYLLFSCVSLSKAEVEGEVIVSGGTPRSAD